MTALRELAELRELVSIIADWKLPETGETWPSGGPVSYEANFGSQGARDYMRNIATKALAILDAEGDGGAVGGMSLFTGTIGGVHVGLHGTKDSIEALDAFLTAHPARSGVVSDEDVIEACEHYDVNYEEGSRAEFIGMRAALEHFAKGDRHER